MLTELVRLKRRPGSTPPPRLATEKGSSDTAALLKSNGGREAPSLAVVVGSFGARGRWRLEVVVCSGCVEGWLTFTVSWNIWLLLPQSKELLILCELVLNRSTSAAKSRSMPLMLASGSQNGFVLAKTGAVAGADIG
jgi:hypothetical protein